MCPPVVGVSYSPNMVGKRAVSLPGGHIGPPLRRLTKMSGNRPRILSFQYPISDEKWRILRQRRKTYLRTTLVSHRRGGPMCPPNRDIVCFLPIFGEFVMPTTAGQVSAGHSSGICRGPGDLEVKAARIGVTVQNFPSKVQPWHPLDSMVFGFTSPVLTPPEVTMASSTGRLPAMGTAKFFSSRTRLCRCCRVRSWLPASPESASAAKPPGSWTWVANP